MVKALVEGMRANASEETQKKRSQEAEAQTWRVEYRVAATEYQGVGNATITMSVPGGGIEQQSEHRLPYTSRTYTFKAGEVATISAQNSNSDGGVTVYIIANGSTRRSVTSNGAYATAMTTWLVGEVE